MQFSQQRYYFKIRYLYKQCALLFWYLLIKNFIEPGPNSKAWGKNTGNYLGNLFLYTKKQIKVVPNGKYFPQRSQSLQESIVKGGGMKLSKYIME